MSLITKDVTKKFGEMNTLILKGISLEIKSGEMVSITGRSGSGKSTLLYILSSLDSPTAGQVFIDGVNIHQLGIRELHHFRNQNMGFVFQFHHLLPELSALENILMPAVKAGQSQEKKQKALEIMSEFSILDKANHRPAQLSGGEQQRVAIARALVMNPRYIFADEPTGNLDTANGLAVINFFKKINSQFGTTIVYVTHDKEFAQMGHRQIQLVDGQLA